MSRSFSPWSLCATLFLSVAGSAIPCASQALANNVENFPFNANDGGWKASTSPNVSVDPKWRYGTGPSSNEGAWLGELDAPDMGSVAYLTSPLFMLDQNKNDPWVKVDISHQFDFPSPNILGQVQFQFSQGSFVSDWQAVPDGDWDHSNGHDDWPTKQAYAPLDPAWKAFGDTSAHFPHGGHANSQFTLLWADFGDTRPLTNGDLIQFRFALANVDIPVPSIAAQQVVWEINSVKIDGVHVVPEPGSLAMAASAAGIGLVGIARGRLRSRRGGRVSA